jgi:Ca2+-binding EF-hand superfamily protein
VNQIIKKIRFKKYSPFKKLALLYLISVLDQNATVDLKRGFEALDQNKDGMIDIQEIKDAIENYELDDTSN